MNPPAFFDVETVVTALRREIERGGPLDVLVVDPRVERFIREHSRWYDLVESFALKREITLIIGRKV